MPRRTPTHASCTTSSATAGVRTYVSASRRMPGEYAATSSMNARSSPARSAATSADSSVRVTVSKLDSRETGDGSGQPVRGPERLEAPLLDDAVGEDAVRIGVAREGDELVPLCVVRLGENCDVVHVVSRSAPQEVRRSRFSRASAAFVTPAVLSIRPGGGAGQAPELPWLAVSTLVGLFLHTPHSIFD